MQKERGMGKKIDIKKIENSTKCQVTFSKRRSSLIKKSHEISVMCDVDVLFLAFSPSGRLTKFCSRNRIEDVLERYIDLPAEKRHQQHYKNPMKNIQEKLEKLKMYDRVIKGDENKLRFLNNQIKHMELQLKKSNVELELFEVNLRDYEPDPSFDPSLAQLLWCEKNLKQSLNRLNDKKRMLFNLPITSNEQMRVQKEQIARDVSFNNGGNDQPNWVSQNLNSSQHRLQLNPWISPNYRSPKVGETTTVQELIGDQIGGKYGSNGALGEVDNYVCSNNNNQLPIIGYQSIQQSGMPLLVPQPSVSTTYTTTYPPILQHQESTAGEWNFVHPNQPLGVLPISAMATDYTSNQNMNMNMNANLPLRSTLSQLECEDFLNPNYTESDTNEKQLAPDPTLIITNSFPPSDPDVELLLPNCNISLEELMGNDDKVITSSVAGNQEDDYSLEWDGFVLAENLINLDDLDIF